MPVVRVHDSEYQQLQGYIAQLVKQSRPTLYDTVHNVTVEAATNFFKHFGEERLFLFGSTGENLKLTSSKDAGDVDMLLCSGKLELPIEHLEFREDTPCFVWIIGIDLNVPVRLIEDKYVPSNLLRHISPELFTFGRAVFRMFTLASDYVRGTEKRNTVIRMGSNVGLSTTEYSGLNLLTDMSPELKERIQKLNERQQTNEDDILERRRHNVQLNWKDMKRLMAHMSAVTRLFDESGISGLNEGQFKHLKRALDQGQELLENLRQDLLENRNIAEAAEAFIDRNRPIHEIRQMVDNELPEQFEATYVSKRSKDFVPALRIKGKVQYMDEWKTRPRVWPSDDVVDEIYNMDVYIVSKNAPRDPDNQKDFCLAFNHAEKKISECMSNVQRNVLLVMKSYLKGILVNRHRHENRELRLTTFHLKTTMYWVMETEDPAMWTDDNVYEAISKVLDFITKSVKNRNLSHFFVPRSNLFAAFEDNDIYLLLDCLDKINRDPVGSIQEFFAIADGQPVKIQFRKYEILDLMDVPHDGRDERVVDIGADAYIDFQRGFEEGPRDVEGNSPIDEAVISFIEPFIETECQRQLCRLVKRWYVGLCVRWLLKRVVERKKRKCLTILRQFIYCPVSNKMKKERLENKLKSFFH